MGWATIPNALSFARLASAPVVAHFILANRVGTAAAVFTASAVTDFVDGVRLDAFFPAIRAKPHVFPRIRADSCVFTCLVGILPLAAGATCITDAILCACAVWGRRVACLNRVATRRR